MQKFTPKKNTMLDMMKPELTRGGVLHCFALPFYIKKYLKKAKEELWKFKYFTMQKYNLPKKSS
jgi:hypothetical protein